MQNGNTPAGRNETLELARKCLALISNIAAQGAGAQDPEHVGYALQELSQVLLERTGVHDRIFEPVAADKIQNLAGVLAELEFLESCAQSMGIGGPSHFPA